MTKRQLTEMIQSIIDAESAKSIRKYSRRSNVSEASKTGGSTLRKFHPGDITKTVKFINAELGNNPGRNFYDREQDIQEFNRLWKSKMYADALNMLANGTVGGNLLYHVHVTNFIDDEADTQRTSALRGESLKFLKKRSSIVEAITIQSLKKQNFGQVSSSISEKKNRIIFRFNDKTKRDAAIDKIKSMGVSSDRIDVFIKPLFPGDKNKYAIVVHKS